MTVNIITTKKKPSQSLKQFLIIQWKQQGIIAHTSLLYLKKSNNKEERNARNMSHEVPSIINEISKMSQASINSSNNINVLSLLCPKYV